MFLEQYFGTNYPCFSEVSLTKTLHDYLPKPLATSHIIIFKIISGKRKFVLKDYKCDHYQIRLATISCFQFLEVTDCVTRFAFTDFKLLLNSRFLNCLKRQQSAFVLTSEQLLGFIYRLEKKNLAFWFTLKAKYAFPY